MEHESFYLYSLRSRHKIYRPLQLKVNILSRTMTFLRHHFQDCLKYKLWCETQFVLRFHLFLFDFIFLRRNVSWVTVKSTQISSLLQLTFTLLFYKRQIQLKLHCVQFLSISDSSTKESNWPTRTSMLSDPEPRRTERTRNEKSRNSIRKTSKIIWDRQEKI